MLRAVRLPHDGLPEGEGDEGERGRDERELHTQVLEVEAKLLEEEREAALREEVRHLDRLVLPAHDGVLEAFPRARVAPVHRRVAQVGDDRHVGVERDAEFREERRDGDGASVRQGDEREGEDEEVPDDGPDEPPGVRVREAVHRALAEEDVDGELHGGDGNRVGEAARRREDEREEGDESAEEQECGFRVGEGHALVAGGVGGFEPARDEDGDEGAGARAGEPLPHRRVAHGGVLRGEDGAERADVGAGEERADPGIGRRFEERRDGGFVRRRPRGRRGEERGGEQHEGDAARADADGDPLRARVAAVREEEPRERGRDEQKAAEGEEDAVRTGVRLRERLELVDDVGGHVAVGAQEAADLEDLRGEADRDEDQAEVAEHADVPERDDDRERDGGEEQHLVVREAEAEDERREPEDAVGGAAHPAVGEQEHRHEEERVERVDLDDRRLRPLDGREGEDERAAEAARERHEGVLPRAVVVRLPLGGDGVEHVAARSADEHRGAAGREGAGDGGEERDGPGGRGLAHVGDPREEAAEDPAAERPEGVPRRMRHAEVVGGGGEFARVLQTHARAEREEVDEERDERRAPEGGPVDAAEVGAGLRLNREEILEHLHVWSCRSGGKSKG